MMRDYFDDYGEPEKRKTAVERHLARLITPDNSDPPAVSQRKAAEAKERLRRQDEFFNLDGGLIGSLQRLTGIKSKTDQADSPAGR